MLWSVLRLSQGFLAAFLVIGSHSCTFCAKEIHCRVSRSHRFQVGRLYVLRLESLNLMRVKRLDGGLLP